MKLLRIGSGIFRMPLHAETAAFRIFHGLHQAVGGPCHRDETLTEPRQALVMSTLDRGGRGAEGAGQMGVGVNPHGMRHHERPG